MRVTGKLTEGEGKGVNCPRPMEGLCSLGCSFKWYVLSGGALQIVFVPGPVKAVSGPWIRSYDVA